MFSWLSNLAGCHRLVAMACWLGGTVLGLGAASQQESLDVWRRLTAAGREGPSVYFDGRRVRCVFGDPGGVVGFSAKLPRFRVPTDRYEVRVAPLRLDRSLRSAGLPGRGWRRAVVITGEAWRQLTADVLESLAPTQPGVGYTYQGLLADRLLYRTWEGEVRSAAVEEVPSGVGVERRFTMPETLAALARLFEVELRRTHPEGGVFLLMAPVPPRFPQPLLLDSAARQCVWLAPSGLYDSADSGLTLAVTVRGLAGLTFASHGLALLKNPVSSVARLGDLGVQTAVRFLRWPVPKTGKSPPPLGGEEGMDLEAWEAWLDRYTATKREEGWMRLLIGGDRVFPRVTEAMEAATNSILVKTYIFDRDDVAVGMADLLKARSAGVEVKVVMDQMASLGAGTEPPGTPLPEEFVAPDSIVSYLRRNSQVEVRQTLNPWLLTDHSKMFLVDGQRAWVGGVNLGREYRHEWHDLMVEVTGPVVGSLEAEFRRIWGHSGWWGDLGYLAASMRRPPAVAAVAAEEPWMAVRRLPTKTAWKPFSGAVQGALRRARSHVFVENPYLFDTRIISGLVLARHRGVDVRVVLPQANDFAMGGRGNLVLANYLLRHGVRVFFFPGMTHVKALLVDGWSCLGSANLNHLSLRLCHEQNLATSDARFAAQLRRELFEEDFERSYELTQPVEVGWADVLADLLLEGF